MRALTSVIVGVFLYTPIATTGQLSGVTAATPSRVCEVLSNLNLYRGRMITVVGVLGGGRRHGLTLHDSASSIEVCPGVKKAGYVWPPAIALSTYTKGSDIEDGPAHFESQSAEIDDMLSGPMRVASTHSAYVVETTLVGELRSRRGIEIIRDENGWFAGTGYGQNGQYPAMLVMYTVRKAKVVRRR